MKFRRNKKGFTIVELIIVIAVIGILTAVMVPTIVHLVNKANKASDEALVSNLNKAVQLRYAETSKKPATMHETVEGLREYGYNLDALVAKSDEHLLYSLNDNKFVLEGAEGVSGNERNYWKIQKSVEASQVSGAEGKKFNIYATDDFDFGTVTSIDVGFDAGNSNVSEVNFVDASNPGHEVVIRTNSQFTDLIIDAEHGTVNHYGVGKILTITNIDVHSYHEKGSWQKITLTAGKLELEEGSFVGELVKNGGELINDGVIAAPITGTAATTDVSGSGINGIEDGNSIKVGNAETLMNLAMAQSNGVFGTDDLEVELTSDIDLTNRTWVPFGAERENATTYKFSGTIDGKGKKIIGLYNGAYKGKISANQSTSTIGDLYGFIATVKGDVTVKNLKFIDVAINDSNSKVCGVVIADTKNADNVTLLNISVTGSVKALDKVGGLIGYAQAANVRIQNCSINATLEAVQESGPSKHNRVGGLIGYIGNEGIVAVYGAKVEGKISGKFQSMFGAITGGLTHNNDGRGVGLKVEANGFSTTATVKEPSEGKVTTSTAGDILIGVNSCVGTNSQKDLAEGFVFENDGSVAHSFLPKLLAE